MKKITVEECQKISIAQINTSNTEALAIKLNDQTIFVTETRCNYGGTRRWFICPLCKKRIGTLYRKPLSVNFFCRNCNNLTYQLRQYHRSRNEEFLRQMKQLSTA